ncbi:hypothetical protein NQ317_001740 [Molorchus minor]|uniref:Small acidic protein-like domain-containing protein n=1 Tax=Molorchus minor TaxID=1323400 RepID=A0ABQ9JUM8_9CUCU|nr:hypothetical protein NQ317_001740 [Molorchus minor]
MNSIGTYESDEDDYNESSDEKQPATRQTPQRSYRKVGHSRQDDVNYDEVQMSLSEDSGDETKASKSRDAAKKQSIDRRDSEDSHRSSSRSRDGYYSRKDRDRSDKKDDKHGRSDREEERGKHREEDRSSRERYRDEDRSRDRRDERRGKSRERKVFVKIVKGFLFHRYSNKDDRYRDRKDRERKRSRSPTYRDRRRSRSPRRSRSRSRSRDRGSRGGYSKRYDRPGFKTARFDKTGLNLLNVTGYCRDVFFTDATQKASEEQNDPKDRFFVPGITGRFREQIEKRKLLWKKAEPEAQPKSPASVPAVSQGVAPMATKVWEATTFAQDTDGKVANKFKRLMGIRTATDGSSTGSEVLKKQEEMFSSMEQQYEVARTATHTMRGVGLGFSSYQR